MIWYDPQLMMWSSTNMLFSWWCDLQIICSSADDVIFRWWSSANMFFRWCDLPMMIWSSDDDVIFRWCDLMMIWSSANVPGLMEDLTFPSWTAIFKSSFWQCSETRQCLCMHPQWILSPPLHNFSCVEIQDALLMCGWAEPGQQQLRHMIVHDLP